MDAATTAKLLVVLLAFAWGLNWVAAAFACARYRPGAARRRLRHRRRNSLFLAASVTGHNMKVPSRRVTFMSWSRVAQCRGISGSLRFRAAQRRHFARHYHHLLDADMDGRAQLARARASVSTRFAVCFRPVHRRYHNSAMATFCCRISSIRFLFSGLRTDMGHCDRLHQMGEIDGRAAGERSMAIAVRAGVYHRRELRF